MDISIWKSSVGYIKLNVKWQTMFLLVDLQMYLGNFTLRLFRSPLVFGTHLNNKHQHGCTCKDKTGDNTSSLWIKGYEQGHKLAICQISDYKDQFSPFWCLIHIISGLEKSQQTLFQGILSCLPVYYRSRC